MTPPVFLAEAGDLAADTVVLAGPEGRHAAAVRRLEPGETVHLVDGAGTRARCRVVEVGRDTVVCAVEERGTDPAPSPELTVVQALPKGDRGELAVEVMTEAGVDRVVPWAAERCVTRWKPDRAAKSLAKWRSAAREAAKQARRSRIPEVTELARTADVAALARRADLAVVLHESARERLAVLPLPDAGSGADAPGTIVVVVGPEGGFSDAELSALAEAGAVRALLGPTVLRTSTAGVAALAVLQARCGRW
ncbi:16S rRNA (uracil(1498)-N(3))-methyltransferase [Streptomonospora sp. S1-112]|uniref:Ribosomal RNA small subunit methyltransferase E n=1 Tax=Streptomonospora mangrovi TaxID=2883123 RepID=A0A9X3SDM6_9ACTN|nr:16S rRNA (uracil(1498)-N(3))-methyltransferase [Streptomonospora mangrovi]MDA0564012.1 16S rRNA (uracil(1498)-N(3))-methyltransferase [Streptomonospora mangrovi]